MLNVRGIQGFFVVASALLGSIAEASLSAPTVTQSSGGTIRALVSKVKASSASDTEVESESDTEALDWASLKVQHEKVDAETQKVQRQTTARLSIGQLLQFLGDIDRVDNTLSETEFIPRCLAHLQKVIKMINATYGQEKLHQVVTDECLQNADFPLASADAFNKKQACGSLVDDLTKMQDQELKTGSLKGYFNFCSSKVVNKDEDGLVAPYTEDSKSAKKQQAVSALAITTDEGAPGIPFIMLTILIALCVVGGAFFSLRQNS